MPYAERIEWEAMKRDYIYGYTERDVETGIMRTRYPTFPELAEKYNCALATINEKSYSDPIAPWGKQRAKIKEKLREKLSNEEVNLVLSDSAKYDLMNLRLVENTFMLLKEFFRPYLDYFENQDAYTEDDSPPRVSVKEMESLSRTLLNLHTLVRNIEGEPINNAEIMKELIKQDIVENNLKAKDVRKKKIAEFIKKQDDKEKRKAELLKQKAELERKLKSAE